MADTPLHIPDLVNRGKWTDYRKDIWGDSYNWSWNRTPSEVKYIAIHHSVTDHNASPDYIAQLHKDRGWGGVGYHFIVTKDGMVWYVGDIGTARANVADMNEKVVGICLIGDFTQYNPSDDQIISAHDLCKFFIELPQWPNVDGWEDVVGHKELQATACPGTNWKGPDDSMYERIKNRIPYTPQTPPVDWKEKYENLSGDYNELKGKYEELNGKWETADQTLTVLQEWKEKIAVALGIGVDWPKILEQINNDTVELDRLSGIEKKVKLVFAKVNELIGRDFIYPDDMDNLLAGVDEYKNLEDQRKQEVINLQDRVTKLEKATRPVDKYKWYELFVEAIKKMNPLAQRR